MSKVGIIYLPEYKEVLYKNGSHKFYEDFLKDSLRNRELKEAVIPYERFVELLIENPNISNWNLADLLDYDGLPEY